jgi:small subunit ribosomal protein S8
MMTDPIADMLTRLRNASRIESPAVDMPATGLKIHIAQVLKDEGYIVDYQLGKSVKDEQGHTEFQVEEKADLSKPHVLLRVFLKYGPEGERVFLHMQRASKPGRRLYRRAKQLKPVLDGLGIGILTTSKGVMSDRQARAQHLGGELLCTIW